MTPRPRCCGVKGTSSSTRRKKDIRTARRRGHLEVGNPTGDPAKIAASNHGFSLEQAIYEDVRFIALGDENGPCTTIAFLPGWEHSSGASGPEFTLAKFLKREFIYL
jgi:hypothetical protein